MFISQEGGGGVAKKREGEGYCLYEGVLFTCIKDVLSYTLNFRKLRGFEYVYHFCKF